MKVLHRLWSDETGFVVSTELILIAVLLVIGLIVGLTTLRDQVVQELADVAGAIGSINDSFSFSGVVGHSSSTAGSVFLDFTDFCDNPVPVGVVGGTPIECIDVLAPATPEAP